MNDEDRDGNIEKKEIQRYDREETNRNRQRKGSQTQMHREQRCKEINTRREAENEKGMGERKRHPEKGEKESKSNNRPTIYAYHFALISNCMYIN